MFEPPTRNYTSMDPIGSLMGDLVLNDRGSSPESSAIRGNASRRLPPVRRSSWLTEVGVDNSRRHSTSIGQAPLPVLPAPVSPPNRSQSFSAGQQNLFAGASQENPSQNRFSSAIATVSESAIEDELEISTQSSESNSAIGGPMRFSRLSTEIAAATNSHNSPHSFRRPSFEASNMTEFDVATGTMLPALYGADIDMAPKYFVVQFKLHRADVFKTERAFGLELQVGDLVIVEADRGVDLGKIISARAAHVQALALVAECQKNYHQELLSFSHNKAIDKEFAPPAKKLLDQAKATDRRSAHPKDVRLILRRPVSDEILRLKDKEHQEAKARRIAHNEAAKLGFNIEVLDAEFQFDYEKLTISYYADYYIHFNNLVNALYKHYKTRIWMSNINQNATNQLPPAFTLPLTAWSPPNLSQRDHVTFLAATTGLTEHQAYQIAKQDQVDAMSRELNRAMPSDPGPIPPSTAFYDWGHHATPAYFSTAREAGNGPSPDPAAPRASARSFQSGAYRTSADRFPLDYAPATANPTVGAGMPEIPSGFYGSGRRYPFSEIGASRLRAQQAWNAPAGLPSLWRR